MCKFNSVAFNKNIAETRVVGYLKSVCKKINENQNDNSGERSDTAESCLPTNMTVTEMNVEIFKDLECGINIRRSCEHES